MTSITAENARGLMNELAQFEIDLGEIGAPLRSEEAYRQLRAMSTGKANDVLALEVEYEQGVPAAFLVGARRACSFWQHLV